LRLFVSEQAHPDDTISISSSSSAWKELTGVEPDDDDDGGGGGIISISRSSSRSAWQELTDVEPDDDDDSIISISSSSNSSDEDHVLPIGVYYLHITPCKRSSSSICTSLYNTRTSQISTQPKQPYQVYIRQHAVQWMRTCQLRERERERERLVRQQKPTIMSNHFDTYRKT